MPAFLFVSPNQQDASTIHDAFRDLHGPDHARLAAATPGGVSGVGFWKDGAEASRFVPVPAAGLRRRMAELGLAHRRKGVIGFDTNAPGGDLHHVVVVPEADPTRVHAGLLSHGVEFATVIPHPEGLGSVAHVIDFGGDAADRVKAYAAGAGGRHRATPGTAHYIGDDDREKAQNVYRGELARG